MCEAQDYSCERSPSSPFVLAHVIYSYQILQANIRSTRYVIVLAREFLLRLRLVWTIGESLASCPEAFPDGEQCSIYRGRALRLNALVEIPSESRDETLLREE